MGNLFRIGIFVAVVAGLTGCDQMNTAKREAAAIQGQPAVGDLDDAGPDSSQSGGPANTDAAGGDGGSIPDDYGRTTPGIEVGRIPTVAHLVIAPAQFDFQVQSLNSFTHQSFLVSNTGESYATLMAGGGLTGDFSFKGGTYPGAGGTCAASLAPGAQCRIVITFRPTAIGRVSSTGFYLRYNEGEVTLDLQGVGSAIATLKLVNLIDENPHYNFGAIPFGGAINHVFRVQYFGARPATGVSFSNLSGPFSIVWNHCGSEIAADCDVAVRYQGLAVGTSSQRLRVTYDNSAFAAETSQRLEGQTASVVTQPLLQVSDHNFGRKLIGSVTEKTITVRKSGTLPALNVHATPFPGGAFDFKGGYYPGVGGTCGATVNADCTVVVSFAPSHMVTTSDSLQLNYDRNGASAQAVGFLSGRGAGPSQISLTPLSDADFGTVPVNRPADRHFRLSNSDSGVVALGLSANGVVAPFRIISSCPASLNPGQSCTLSVRFSPTQAVHAEGQLSVAYFDGVDVRVLTQAVSGDGGELADIRFTQTAVDFGNLRLGMEQVIEVNVEYYGVLTGGHCTVGGIDDPGSEGGGGEGADDDGFEFPGGGFPGGGTCPRDINAPCTIRVTFVPTEIRTYSTLLTLYYDDGSGEVRSTVVRLTGRGLGTAPAVLGFAAPTANFGPVIVGSQKNLTVTVSRAGDLAASGLALTGLGDGVQFLGGVSPGTGGTCGGVLNQGSCTFVLSYRPSAAGLLSRNLTLNYHDGQAPQTVSVVATAEAVDAANLTAAPAAFGKVGLGSSKEISLTVTNSGTAAATGLNVGISQLPVAVTVKNHGCPTELAASASCVLTLEMTPARPGAVGGVLTLAYENGRGPASLSLSVAGAGTVPVLVSAGGNHTCARVDDGQVKCWGQNNVGQLGVGDTAGRSVPSQKVSLGVDHYAKSIAVGFWHSCAVLEDDSVKCWGANSYGQLGQQSSSPSLGSAANQLGENLPAIDLGEGVREVAAGYAHTCALLLDGNVKCWGFNGQGQLGLGDVINRGADAQSMGDGLAAVDLGGVAAVSLSANTGNTCAVLENGEVKCWGNNFYGQLGLGDAHNRGDLPDQMGANLPAVALGAQGRARTVTAGGAFTCALLEDGTVKCWGRNEDGILGTLWCQNFDGLLGNCADSAFSLPLRGYGLRSELMGSRLESLDLGTGRTAVSLHAGNSMTCAGLDDGTVKCWGENSSGQLGTGDAEPRGMTALQLGDGLAPLALRGSVRAISAGGSHACAVLVNESIQCWGSNRYGELGLGDTNNRGDEPNEMGAALPPLGL